MPSKKKVDLLIVGDDYSPTFYLLMGIHATKAWEPSDPLIYINNLQEHAERLGTEFPIPMLDTISEVLDLVAKNGWKLDQTFVMGAY